MLNYNRKACAFIRYRFLLKKLFSIEILMLAGKIASIFPLSSLSLVFDISKN